MDSAADDHDAMRALLPWYVSGRLDAAEHSRVNDHLAACAACRHDVDDERAIAAQVARMPVDVDLGWAAMRRRIEGGPVQRRFSPKRIGAAIGARPRALLLIAAQFVALIGAAVLLATRPAAPAADYHVLGSAQAARPGNALILFAPGTPTDTAATLLSRSQARIVDGPTETGAFMLAVPAGNRAQALAALRADRAVAMAEPIDP